MTRPCMTNYVHVLKYPERIFKKKGISVSKLNEQCNRLSVGRLHVRYLAMQNTLSFIFHSMNLGAASLGIVIFVDFKVRLALQIRHFFKEHCL